MVCGPERDSVPSEQYLGVGVLVRVLDPPLASLKPTLCRVVGIIRNNKVGMQNASYLSVLHRVTYFVYIPTKLHVGWKYCYISR